MEELGGIREVARRLGVSRQRVYQLVAANPGFPAPVAELEMGRIWRMTDIDQWRGTPRPPKPAQSKAPWLDRRSDQVMDLLASSQNLVRGLQHSQIRLEHIVMAMVDDDAGVAGELLRRVGVSGSRARRYLKELRGTAPEPHPLPPDVQASSDLRPFAPELWAALTTAVELVDGLGMSFVRTDHLLLAIVETPHNTGWDMLRALGVDVETFDSFLREGVSKDSTETKTKSYRTDHVTTLPSGVVMLMTTPQPAEDPQSTPSPSAGTDRVLSELLDEVRQLRAEVAAIRSDRG